MKTYSKKKILYVITKGNFGGAQRYVFDLATSLPKEMFDVSVLCGEGNILPKKLRQQNIKTLPLQELGRNIKIFTDIKILIELIKIFRREKPDIIHLNSSKAGGIGALAGRLARVPRIIFTAHGWPFKEDRPFLIKKAIKLFSWITAVLAHTTIVVSKDDLEKSKNFPLCKEKIHLIYNGIGNTTFKEGFQARQLVGNHIQENIWIGTIAELNHNKGIDILLKAYAEIAQEYTDAALIIIGDGVEKENLKLLAQKLGIEKRVYFLGFMEKASYVIKAFDMFCLTSRKEGVPYVILEAGKACVPVISTPVGGVPETIFPFHTGLLSKTITEKDVAETIRFGLQNPQAMKEYGENLRNLIQTSFTLSRMIEKTTETYLHENNHTTKQKN